MESSAAQASHGEDPTLVLARELRGHLNELVGDMATQPLPHPHTNARWAAMMILARASECLRSIELLASHGYERDAAVLVVVLLELQYDVAYIAADVERASVWLAHAAEGRKPWPVRALQEALYPTVSERESHQANYSRFSMVKHSNPVAGTNSFPVAFALPGPSLDVRPSSPDVTTAYVFSAALTCCAIAGAAASCMGPSQATVVARLESVRDLEAQLNREMERRMIEILAEVGGHGG